MTILIPTDFSDCAKNATDYGFQLAHKLNADVILMNTYEMKYSDAGLFLDFDDSMKSISLKNLEKESLRLRGTFNFFNDVKLKLDQRIGSLDYTVNQYQSEGVDLVIMGTKGRSGIEEILIGSETARVIGNSEIKTLVIPDDAKFTPSKRTVCSLDLKEDLSRKEAELIAALGEEENSYYLFHNYHDAFEIDVEDEHNLQLKFRNHFPGCLIYLNLNFDSDDLEAIERFIDEKKADLTVVRSKHRNLLQSLFHKSISEKLSYHLSKPLLVLK